MFRSLQKHCRALSQLACDSLDRLEQLGAPIDNDTYANLLRKCAISGNVAEGKRIHARICGRGPNVDRFLGNLLVEMYGKCGCIEEALRAFQAIRRKNIFSWNIMIGAYVQNGRSREALDLFREMDRNRIEASNVTFVSLLSACADLRDLTEAKAVHARIMETDFQTQIIVANAIINMYGRCNSVGDARQVFDTIPCKNVISWNSIITAYALNGHCREALALYQQMDPEGVKANRVTYLTALDACSIQGAIRQGRAIHLRIIEAGLDSDIPLSNSLVNMYAKCGRLDEARRLFFHSSLPRNVVSWTAMITAYAQHGYGNHSLQLYREMDLDGVLPDEITLISVLDACASIKALKEGREIHQQVLCRGFEQHVVVATALMNMYSECGELEEAKTIFDGMNYRTVVTWNTMIGCYTQNGHPKQALELFQLMDQTPNEVTLAAVIEACASSSNLKQGRELHARVISMGCQSSNLVGSALVNLYGKCGSVKEARFVFQSMSRRDLVSWSAMISAYSHHGWGDEALELFTEMNLDGVFPNAITFLSVLVACSHSGLLKTAHQHFVAMSSDYGIDPTSDHYDCFIDVLGRAGKVQLAEELIESMPYQPGPVIWMSLLAASKMNGDFTRGQRAAEVLFELDPGNSAAYLVVSNMYTRR